MLDRLSLGTVQFGSAYGISNKTGKIPKEEVFKILEYAHKEGIDTLDTAYAYGDSEQIIGEFISKAGYLFNIISKLPDLKDYNILEADRFCSETLKRLRQPKIYGYLTHRFDNILMYKGLLDKLESLKQKGFVQKVGVSLYKTEELQYLLNNNIHFDIIQVPYSIFDRRFESSFGLLREKNVEIYVRSVFLQGLVFLKPYDLPKNLIKARDYIIKLQSLASEYNVSVNGLCLNFVLLNTYIDKVIIGVESLKHLKKNIKDIESIEKVRDIQDILNNLHIEDENIILPYKWSKK